MIVGAGRGATSYTGPARHPRPGRGQGSCRTGSKSFKPSPSPRIRGVSQEKDGQISSAIVSSVQSKITQVRRARGLPFPSPTLAGPGLPTLGDRAVGRSESLGAGHAPSRGVLHLNPMPPRTLPES